MNYIKAEKIMFTKIAVLLPIVFLFLLLAYSKQVSLFSRTILGKLIAVSTIIFYTSVDKILGLFICLLVIVYYQSDYYENMLNLDMDMDMDMKTLNETPDIIDDGIYLDYTDKKRMREPFAKELKYQEIKNQDVKIVDLSITDKEAKSRFQKANCKGTSLYNKNVEMNSEMAEHVYPEIAFSYNTCNPCKESCEYSIVENKIRTEEEIRK